MKSFAEMDDPGRVRAMVWMAVAAAPLTALCTGVGLILSYATLNSQGKDVAKAEPRSAAMVGVYFLFVVYIGTVDGCRSPRTLARLISWLFVGLMVASAAHWGLLASTRFSTASGDSAFITCLVMFPVVAALGYYLFRRNQKANT